MIEYNWKLINSLSIPAGIIMGWAFNTRLLPFVKYTILIAVLAGVGIAVNKLSASNKKSNTFTSAAIIILIVMLFYLFRSIV